MTSYNTQEETKEAFSSRTHPLDESLYALTPEESAFFKSWTGIDDDDDLKKHILAVQASAYKTFPYPTIRRFVFTKLKISKLPGYNQLVTLGRERQGALMLDIGCGFGHDTRKAISDGFPAENVVASDIDPEFWKFGHDLFRTDPETFPVKFLKGDVLESAFLARKSVLYQKPPNGPPDLATLTSLTPLHGQLSVISVIALFHLFDEEQQIELACRLGALLSPEPGSMIIGWQMGSTEKKLEKDLPWAPMLCQSPQSWTDVWNGIVFQKGTVKVEMVLGHVPEVPDDMPAYGLYWCVIRL